MTATITLAHAVVTLTLDPATPTPRAAEMSRRRFEPASEAAPMSGHDPQQPVELERVSARIGATIVAWCAERLFAGDREFHLEEVVAAVSSRVGGAPDSVSRVLRALRAKGAIAYVVVRRHESLCRLVRVGALEAA